MNELIVNGYEIWYNPVSEKLIINHPEIGAGIAEFDELNEAIEYCLKG